MSPREEPDDLEVHYRRMSAQDSSRPSEQVYARVMAQIPEVVREHRRSRLRRRAVWGMLAAAGLAAVLILPWMHVPSSPGGGEPPALAATPRPRLVHQDASPEYVKAEEPPDPGAGLREAASQGEMGRLQRLTSSSVSLESRDAQGRTALLLAVQHRQLAAVRWLVAHGADRNARDAQGLTPVEAARRSQDPTLIAALGP